MIETRALRGWALATGLLAIALGGAQPVAAQTGPSERHQDDAPARHHFFVAVDNDN